MMRRRLPRRWPKHAHELYRQFEIQLEQKLASASQCLRYLQPFLRYQASRGLSYRDFPLSVWDKYQAKLTPDNRRNCRRALRNWLKFLYARHELLSPLHEQFSSNQRFSRRPRRILTYAEVLRLMGLPDLNNPQGLRDRAMLEMAYSGGLRTGELIRLELPDLDIAGGSVALRWTKNRRDRVIPLGKWALHFLQRYLREARPQLASPLSPPALWLGRYGRRLHPVYFGKRLRAFNEHLGFRMTTYLLRHACATHLLQQGASLRLVQELLGHESLQSTQHYTRVTPMHLQRMHRLYHPRNLPEFGDEWAD